MKMRFQIDTETCLVYITYSGEELTFFDWTKTMNCILQDPLFKTGFGFLFDRRDINVAPEREFGKSVSMYMKAHISELSDSHFAIVVTGLATYGIMRMVQGILGETEHFMVFRDIEKAKHWLAEKTRKI